MEDNFIKINRWFYPVAFLYGIGVRLRNKLFDWGILHSTAYDIPVISIGNITVGGTGKTPHTEYLIRLLQKDFKVAVLSRGYKRKSTGFQLIGLDTSAEQSGDEPYQIKQKFPDIYMAVDKDRRHGIELLSREDIAPNVEVILLDDAFQHRYVQPGINILLIDYHRLICNDALLPAGRLREPASGKHRANIVIITKCPTNIKPMEYRILSKQLDLYPYQQLYFSTLKYGDLTPIVQSPENKVKPLSSLSKDDNILLFTGIASPKQIIRDLEAYTSTIESLSFPDHHFFNKEDVDLLTKRFQSMPGEKKIIVTTEKDAARLTCSPHFSDELKKYIYVLPIEIEFLQNQQDSFNQNIIGYVRKNKRNSILSKRENAYKS